MSKRIPPVMGSVKQISMMYVACYSRDCVSWETCTFKEFAEAVDFLKHRPPEFRYLRIYKESVMGRTDYYKQFDVVRPRGEE